MTVKTSTPLAVDKTITLNINGSRQRIRLCAVRSGLPPLLVVQGGPALPLLNEVAKFQRLLNLEHAFSSGTGNNAGAAMRLRATRKAYRSHSKSRIFGASCAGCTAKHGSAR